MIDLHRHDDYSLFDGLGKPMELARLAKEYGYEALSSSNHGKASGMIEHYLACKEAGIKPVMGVEAYFMPKFQESTNRYHLCLFCKDIQGYKNLNRMLSYANIKQFYYKPIVTFDLLEKYHNGLICTSACIAGYISSKIANGKTEVAEKAARKFKSIFGDDFYIEIQPYKISTPGLQEKVNEELIRIAQKLDIKMVLTSDSHFGREEDLDTYVKIHAIRGRDEQSTMAVYKERYMPRPNELKKRFMRMHGDLDTAEKLC